MRDRPNDGKDTDTPDKQAQLSLTDEALTPRNLKAYLQANSAKIDTDHNGFFDAQELQRAARQFPILSRDSRVLGAALNSVDDIQSLHKDERWYQSYKGISFGDIDAFDNLAQQKPADRRVSKVRNYLDSRNYEDALAKATDLKEDQVHSIELKFKKSSFTLDPWKHLDNELKAETQTMLVGERQYDKYKVGQELSSKDDWAGFLFHGELATYHVSVAGKHIDNSYSWVDKSGTTHPLTKAEHDALGAEFQHHGKFLQRVPYSDATHTYIMKSPLNPSDVVQREPMHRYFMDVEVKNSSFTPSISKMLRNSLNTHKIEIEVPREQYLKSDRAWKPHLNVGSLLVGGRLSQMEGDIKRKWQETDPNFEEVTTKDGRRLIVAKQR